ncbi:MAG: hypothetical protein ABSA71_19500 [Desulfomonilia bacterium]|jgi:hypothetical protein
MNQLPKSSDELKQILKAAAKMSDRNYLIYDTFKSITGIPMSLILRHYDSWTEACKDADVTPGQASPQNITPRYSKGKHHALSEVKRIAAILGTDTLSRSELNSHNPEVKAATVANLWGGWNKALEAAGLKTHPLFYENIPIAELAKEFLIVFHELKGKVPTAHQISRRSRHGKNTFTRKFGSYSAFKIKVIEYLLSNEKLTADARLVLESCLDSLGTKHRFEAEILPRPHAKGRHLGFRAFAFAPTYEAEVVSLFSSVADELGFEIVAQRSAFPDCEARRLIDRIRKRYEKCLIEFEFRSSDYKKHRHPLKGCNLIICWEHNWVDCPLEVLELKSEINRLPGWK